MMYCGPITLMSSVISSRSQPVRQESRGRNSWIQFSSVTPTTPRDTLSFSSSITSLPDRSLSNTSNHWAIIAMSSLESLYYHFTHRLFGRQLAPDNRLVVLKKENSSQFEHFKQSSVKSFMTFWLVWWSWLVSRNACYFDIWYYKLNKLNPTLNTDLPLSGCISLILKWLLESVY